MAVFEFTLMNNKEELLSLIPNWESALEIFRSGDIEQRISVCSDLVRSASFLYLDSAKDIAEIKRVIPETVDASKHAHSIGNEPFIMDFLIWLELVTSLNKTALTTYSGKVSILRTCST